MAHGPAGEPLSRRRTPRSSPLAAGLEPGFWRTRPLEALSRAEWEALCDGCGLCCQIRVEDPDTGEIALSDVACHLLDLCTHRCRDYPRRRERVPDCVGLTPENVRGLSWLPWSCAYRLVAFGFDLPEWHHLVCGDPEAVHRRGPSMRGALVSEEEVDWAEEALAERGREGR